MDAATKRDGVRIPTVRDVARVAGVSHTTVSRVINGGTIVSAETRRAVEEAIAALDYAPSPVARALSGAEHLRIALLHRFPNPGSLGEFLVHLLDHATRAHVSLVVREVAEDDDHAATVGELVRRGVKGAILAPPLADSPGLVDLLMLHGIAIVATGSTSQGDRVTAVGVDDHAAAMTMTRHLLALGHRRIGFISGDPQYASARLRLAGFRRAMEEAGLAVHPSHVAQGSYTYQSGLAAAERLLDLAERPTAIFASNDDMAAATVAVAHRHRLDVPGELSVCGYDDSALATTIWPALTTIRRPTVEITGATLHALLAQLPPRDRIPRDGGHVAVQHELVRRQSDGPPPSGHEQGSAR